MAEDKNLDDFTVPDAVEYLEGRLAFLEQVILITLSALPEEKRRERPFCRIARRISSQ